MRDSSIELPRVVRYGRRRSQILVAIASIGSAIYLWQNSMPPERSVGFWVLIVVFALMAIPNLFFRESRFHYQNLVVERRWRFFGLFPVWRRRIPLSEFCCIRLWRESGMGSEDCDLWHVEFERRKGHRLLINSFYFPHGRECLEARSLANELSRLTGLTLNDEIDAD